MRCTHKTVPKMTDELFDMPTSCLDQPLVANLIGEGHKVILKKDKFYKIVTVQANRLEPCEKSKVKLNGAIGKPYESLFLIQGQELVHVTDRKQFEDFAGGLPKDHASQTANTRDNRNLTAAQDNQSLTPDDISLLRSEGKTGAEIVSHLVENSASFSEKTVFSQAKYLKKKKKKHMEVVTILRPTTRNLCEMYAMRGIQKILGLRVDTVAFLLAHINVHSGANVLMHETCAGLLLGAVLERLGSEGHLLHFHHTSAPVRPECHGELAKEANELILDIPLQEATALRLTCNVAVHAFDGAQSSAKRRRTAQKKSEEADAINLSKGEEEGKEEEEKEKEETESGNGREGRSEEMEAEETGEEVSAKDSVGNSKKRALSSEESETRRAERRQRLDMARTALVYEPWNALLIATKFHPAAPTLTLLHFLSPGAPFAVYCQRMQPLVELVNLLKRRGEVVMLELSEGWMRPYQVLPQRSHPEMTINGGGGGYVLTGYKACGPFGKSRTAEADYEEGLLVA